MKLVFEFNGNSVTRICCESSCCVASEHLYGLKYPKSEFRIKFTQNFIFISAYSGYRVSIVYKNLVNREKWQKFEEYF